MKTLLWRVVWTVCVHTLTPSSRVLEWVETNYLQVLGCP